VLALDPPKAAAEPLADTQTAQTTQVARDAAYGAVEQITVQSVRLKAAEQAEAEIQHSAQPVTLFSAERLEDSGIGNVRDLMRQTPGLTGIPANNFSDQEFFIRGIGEQDPQGEPSIGVYIDGVFIPKLLGTNQELLDIENVRIVRGPDGFDGGHTGEGGGIHIETTIPDNTVKATAEAGIGTFDEWKIGEAVSGPIVEDKVYASLALSHHERDGINVSLPNDEPGTDIDYTQGRAKLRFTPTSDLDIILAFDGTDDHGTNYVYGNLAAPDGDHYDGHNPIYPKNDYTELGWSGTAKYRINDELQLTSLTSVRGFSNQSYYDNTGDAFARSTQLLHYEDRAYSEDFKLSGDYGRVSFDTGLYAFHENWTTDRRANNAYSAAGTYSATKAILSPVDAFIDQDNWIYSAYSDARIKLTEQLSAELGLRENYEVHQNHEELYCLEPGAVAVAGGAAFCPTGGTETTSSQISSELNALKNNGPGALAWANGGKARYATLTPKIALDYQWTPDVLQYVSYSQQEKPGGFDYRGQTVGVAATGVPSAAVLAESEYLASRQEQYPYSPETLSTYETGLKTDLFEHLALVNVTAFYNEFHNIQLTTTDLSQIPALAHRFNDGSADSYGAELEATLHPIDGLEVYAFGDYLFSRLDHINSPTGIVYYGETAVHSTPFVGAKLPDAPRWKGAISANYDIPTPGLPGQVKVGVTTTFTGSYYGDTTNNVFTELPRQTLTDALVNYTSEDGHWSLQLTAKDLFNKRYPEGLTYVALPSTKPAAVAAAPAYYSVFYNDPRTFFFDLKYRF
jgi:iron complex outermembrane receptor protein